MRVMQDVKKAQVTIEFLLVLAVAAMLFLIALLTFQQGVGGLKSASRATNFVNSLESVFDAADSLPPGAQKYVQVSIPPGLTNFQETPGGDGWFVISFEFSGQQWSKRVPYKVTFIPSDFANYPGEHPALIYSKSQGDVVVQLFT